MWPSIASYCVTQEQSEALQVTKHHDLLVNASDELLHLALPIPSSHDPRQTTNKKTQ